MRSLTRGCRRGLAIYGSLGPTIGYACIRGILTQHVCRMLLTICIPCYSLRTWLKDAPGTLLKPHQGLCLLWQVEAGCVSSRWGAHVGPGLFQLTGTPKTSRPWLLLRRPYVQVSSQLCMTWCSLCNCTKDPSDACKKFAQSSHDLLMVP